MNPKLFNPDYLLHLCKKYHLRPSKKYCQNFLLSPETIEAMLISAEVNSKDTVVEVGPGLGALTFALAARAKKVVAFEIEKKLQIYWDEEIKKINNLEIICGNVLKEFSIFNFQNIKYKVVANLPYQITSRVIRTFLEAENSPSVMVFMVQKEVAERICAKPGDMSLLAISVQYYAQVEIAATVPHDLFWPEPKVDSAVIKITPFGVRAGATEESFFKIVKIGFAQRRKLLLKNLEPFFGKKDKLRQIFEQIGLPEKVRAQDLSLEQWRKLVIHLCAL